MHRDYIENILKHICIGSSSHPFSQFEQKCPSNLLRYVLFLDQNDCPHEGSRSCGFIVRIDRVRFPMGYCKRRLNQGLFSLLGSVAWVSCVYLSSVVGLLCL